MRLLVVEDEPRIAEIIRTALERAEFVVDTVRLRADAREAQLQRAKAGKTHPFVSASK